jgi:hypothetical protein
MCCLLLDLLLLDRMLQHIFIDVPPSRMHHEGHLHWAAAVQALQCLNVCTQWNHNADLCAELELGWAQEKMGVGLA